TSTSSGPPVRGEETRLRGSDVLGCDVRAGAVPRNAGHDQAMPSIDQGGRALVSRNHFRSAARLPWNHTAGEQRTQVSGRRRFSLEPPYRGTADRLANRAG